MGQVSISNLWYNRVRKSHAADRRRDDETDEGGRVEMYNILFYGDSNTWGYNPANERRYPYDVRWTTICARLLGEGFNCIPVGMNGRTTAFDDPLKPLRNGCKEIDHDLQSHKPLDLVVIMLGTNDMKFKNAKESAAGLDKLVRKVLSVNERFSTSSAVFEDKPAILIISPIHLSSSYGTSGYDDIAESKLLAEHFQAVAEQYGLAFMDAADFAKASGIDGEHLSADGHEAMGRAVAEKIKKITSTFTGE